MSGKDLRELTTEPSAVASGEGEPPAKQDAPPASDGAKETPSSPAPVPPEVATEKSAPSGSKPAVTDAEERKSGRSRAARQPSERFEIRALPIIWVLILTAVLLLLPTLIVDTISDFVGLPVYGSELANTVASHTVMLLLALGIIWLYVRSGRRSWESFGLNWPPARSYVPTAFIVGVLFGCAMAFVDYAPDIAAHRPLHGYEMHPNNPAGWLLFRAFYVGPSEEIPFRALLVGYLAAAMPGKIRIGRFVMNAAGIVVAAIFAIGFGLYALVAKDFLIAVGEGAYIFIGSAALAYWLEKSKSIVAPIVGHNAALLTWQALVFWMVYATH